MKLPKSIRAKTFTNKLSKSYRVGDKRVVSQKTSNKLSKSYRDSDKKEIIDNLKRQKFAPDEISYGGGFPYTFNFDLS